MGLRVERTDRKVLTRAARAMDMFFIRLIENFPDFSLFWHNFIDKPGQKQLRIINHNIPHRPQPLPAICPAIS